MLPHSNPRFWKCCFKSLADPLPCNTGFCCCPLLCSLCISVSGSLGTCGHNSTRKVASAGESHSCNLKEGRGDCRPLSLTVTKTSCDRWDCFPGHFPCSSFLGVGKVCGGPVVAMKTGTLWPQGHSSGVWASYSVEVWDSWFLLLQSFQLFCNSFIFLHYNPLWLK